MGLGLFFVVRVRVMIPWQKAELFKVPEAPNPIEISRRDT